MAFDEWWNAHGWKRAQPFEGIARMVWDAAYRSGMDRAADVAQEIAGDDSDWECGAIAASNRIRFEAGTLHVDS